MGRVSANNECELILISPIQQASFSESFARIDWFASFSDGCFATTFQTVMIFTFTMDFNDFCLSNVFYRDHDK